MRTARTTYPGAPELGTRLAFHNAGTFLKTGTLTPTREWAGPGTVLEATFDNSGTVEGAASGRWVHSFSQTAGITQLNGGAISVFQLDIQGGRLTGSGSVFGSVLNGGQLSPGFSPGMISISDNCVQTSAGVFDVELGGLTAGTQYDQLRVTESVMLAGTLNVSIVNGSARNLYDMFTIIAKDGPMPLTAALRGWPKRGS